MSNGEGVTYTVKELISMLERTLTDQMEGIVRRLDTINEKLDEKSSNLRVDSLEQRVRVLELAAAGAAAISKRQMWLLAAVGIPGFAALASLIWLAAGGR